MSTATPHKLEKKPVKFSNLLLGAGLNMFEVTTLGQVNTTLTLLLLESALVPGSFDLGLGCQNKNNHLHYHLANTAITVASLPLKLSHHADNHLFLLS
jgi:hypothetical protein